MDIIYTLRILIVLSLLTAISGISAAHSGTGPEIDKDGNEVFHAELTHNITPIMPLSANESGYCCVILDVQTSGRVKNTEVIHCSNPIFRDMTERTAPKITYMPRQVNGVEVESLDKLTYFSYRLHNEFGDLIKNKDGYPEFDADDEHLTEHYCHRYIS